jgi:hypothetical protein
MNGGDNTPSMTSQMPNKKTMDTSQMGKPSTMTDISVGKKSSMNGGQTGQTSMMGTSGKKPSTMKKSPMMGGAVHLDYGDTDISFAPMSSNIQYIKISYPSGQAGCIQISQLAVFSNGQNVAQGKVATAANLYSSQVSANTPIDGTLQARAYPSIYHSACAVGDYWQLDLQDEYPIDRIVYYNRQDCCNDRANGLVMQLIDRNDAVVKSITLTASMIQSYNFRGDPKVLDLVPMRYAKIYFADGSASCIQISQLAIYSNGKNVAQGKPVSSTGSWTGNATDAGRAVNGVLAAVNYPSGGFAACNSGNYWQVDLQSEYPVDKIVYYNRLDCCPDRADGMTLELFDNDMKSIAKMLLTEAMVQTYTFHMVPRAPPSDPYRFMDTEKKCAGYTHLANQGSTDDRNYFKTQLSEICMPYYSGSLKTCKRNEGLNLIDINNKINQCANQVHTCQSAFNIDTQDVIISAVYGVKDKNTINVLATLNKLKGEGSSIIQISNALFGSDPAPGLHKKLYLSVKTSYNAVVPYEIGEGKALNFDAPGQSEMQSQTQESLPFKESMTFSTLQSGQRGGWSAANSDTGNDPSMQRFLSSFNPFSELSTPVVDKHPECKVWATKTPSECNINPDFMQANCAKSCASVPKGAPITSDLNRAANNRYNIEHHNEYVEFKKHYKPLTNCPDKRYVKKADVQHLFNKTLKLVEKLNDLKNNFSTDIRAHPDYNLLLDKFALKDTKGNYIPCKPC